jgi:hypothetical protein
MKLSTWVKNAIWTHPINEELVEDINIFGFEVHVTPYCDPDTILFSDEEGQVFKITGVRDGRHQTKD